MAAAPRYQVRVGCAQIDCLTDGCAGVFRNPVDDISLTFWRDLTPPPGGPITCDECHTTIKMPRIRGINCD